MSTLAVLATVPGREFALETCLRSLRPQVDLIRVICHNMDAPPRCVSELANGWTCETDLRGSAAKLEWARTHVGLYLACDDDWEYPPDYVATMRRWVRRWKGRALVTAHGRILAPESVQFGHVEDFWPPQGANTGAWLNYPGACALAFDTRLQVPDSVPGKSLEEAYLAIWAQETKTPIWLVPHTEGWLRYLLKERPDVPTIWDREKRAGFADRNEIFQTYRAVTGKTWQVYHA